MARIAEVGPPHAEFEQFRADAYFLAAGGVDSPQMQWTETEREARQVASTFAEMVDAELRLVESNHRRLRRR